MNKLIHRCQMCKLGCKHNSYNKYLVNKIPDVIFANMINNGLYCEDVYIEEDEDIEVI